MAELSATLKKQKKKGVKVERRKITLGKILNDFLEDRMTKQEMNELSTSGSELGDKLREILEATDSFKKTKDYARYLVEYNLKHSTANLAKFLEESQEKEITHRRKEKKAHEEGQSEEEETEEEEAEVETESETETESEVETEEQQKRKKKEDLPKFTMEDELIANMLMERIQREKDLETQRIERVQAKSKKSPRVHHEKSRTLEVSVAGHQPGGVIEYIGPSANLAYFEMSDRQLTMCSNEYRHAVWLNSPEKRVVGVYCDDHRFGVANRSFDYMDEKWYAVNKNYFTVQCKTPRELKTQRGDTAVFMSNSGKKTEEIKFKILYAFNNGTLLLQDEDVFQAEQTYFMEKYANPEQRKDLLLSRPFYISSGVLARNLGRRQFEGIPEGDAIEESIALKVSKMHDPTIMDYFEEIANISAYLKDNSVFKQRLQMGYYSGVDISELDDYEKFDYAELRDYYLNVFQYEVYSLGWSLFGLTYMKHFNKPEFKLMPRPEIEDENLDGTLISYDEQVMSIDSLIALGKKAVKRTGKFNKKIERMRPRYERGVAKEVHRKSPVPDIFDVLEENLKEIKTRVLPKLQKSAKLDEFKTLYM